MSVTEGDAVVATEIGQLSGALAPLVVVPVEYQDINDAADSPAIL
ncbi:MAG: hypothetical protein WCA31_10870 [Acidimicrobiales bacterium]